MRLLIGGRRSARYNPPIECGRAEMDSKGSSSLTTTTLLRQLGEPSNEPAWREVDARFRPLVLGLARRMGLDEDDSGEVAQETLVQFYRDYRAGKYDRAQGRLRAWLIGIARHRIADLRRRKAVQHHHHGDSVLKVLPDEAELSALWEEEARQVLMARALDELDHETKLSPRTRTAFRRHVLEQRSPEEVAAELGVAVRVVYVAKHRCLARLRAILAELTTTYELL